MHFQLAGKFLPDIGVSVHPALTYTHPSKSPAAAATPHMHTPRFFRDILCCVVCRVATTTTTTTTSPPPPSSATRTHTLTHTHTHSAKTMTKMMRSLFLLLALFTGASAFGMLILYGHDGSLHHVSEMARS